MAEKDGKSFLGDLLDKANDIMSVFDNDENTPVEVPPESSAKRKLRCGQPLPSGRSCDRRPGHDPSCSNEDDELGPLRDERISAGNAIARLAYDVYFRDDPNRIDFADLAEEEQVRWRMVAKAVFTGARLILVSDER